MKIFKLRNYLRKFKHEEDIDVQIDEHDRVTFIITDKDGEEIVKMGGEIFE